MRATDEQLHAALMYCIDFARTMLTAAGEFYPFGATIDHSGRVVATAVWNGEEHPSKTEIYELLLDSSRNALRVGGAIGLAVAADVNIPDGYDAPYRDGVRVLLETEGYARYAYIPYLIETSGFLKKTKQVNFAEPFAVEIGAQE